MHGQITKEVERLYSYVFDDGHNFRCAQGVVDVHFLSPWKPYLPITIYRVEYLIYGQSSVSTKILLIYITQVK
jgi:hypothetical protein